jgi:hypothetical protein
MGKFPQNLLVGSGSSHLKSTPKLKNTATIWWLDPRPLITKDHQNLNVGSRSTNWKNLLKLECCIHIHSLGKPIKTCRLDMDPLNGIYHQNLLVGSRSIYWKSLPKLEGWIRIYSFKNNAKILDWIQDPSLQKPAKI